MSGTVLLTGVGARVATSLPAASWSAAASLPAPGSVYETVTGTPEGTAEASVSTTVLPEIDTPVTTTALPLTSTRKAPAGGGLAASSTSSNVSTSDAPPAPVAAETKAGGVVSPTVLTTAVAARLAASLPAASWMALASLPGVGSL